MASFGGFDCSQAILSAWCEDYDLDTETALKLSCGLAGEMARLSSTCGAVSGAYLVIGLAYGKFQPYDNEAREKTYALIQEFDRQFKLKHGTTNCTELLGVDLRYGDMTFAKEQVMKKCAGYVHDTAEILDGILRGENQ